MQRRTTRKPDNSAGNNFHRKCHVAYSPARTIRLPKQNIQHFNYKHFIDLNDEIERDHELRKKRAYSKDPVRKKSGNAAKLEKNIDDKFETRKHDPDHLTERLIDKRYYNNLGVVDPVPFKSATNTKQTNFNIPEEDEKLSQEPEIEHMDWDDYHPLEVIYNYLDELESSFPSLCTTVNIGTTVEGREIKILKISNSNASNVSVWVDAGIHAREWIAPAVNTYIADHICRNFDTLPDSIKNKDWYFLPVVNPDGYEYSHTTDRMWRKNRARHGNQCFGVDLNRNFSLGWGGRGSSDQPTNAFYRGSQPFSEPESSAVRDVLVNSGINFEVYITLHSYGQIIIFPYACTTNLAPDYVHLLQGATAMSKAIYETNGNTYKVGLSRDVMYGASGTSNDFAHGVAGIPYCYLIELRSKKYKFKLPKEEIKDTSYEILNCVKALMEFIDANKFAKKPFDSVQIINPENKTPDLFTKTNTSVKNTDPHVSKDDSMAKNIESYDKTSYSYVKRKESLMKESDSYIRWTHPLKVVDSYDNTGDALIQKNDSTDDIIQKKTDSIESKVFKKPGVCYLKKKDSKFSDTSEKGTDSYDETGKNSFHKEDKSLSSSDTEVKRTHCVKAGDSFIKRNSSFLKKTAFFDEICDSFLSSNSYIVNKTNHFLKKMKFLATNDTVKVAPPVKNTQVWEVRLIREGQRHFVKTLDTIGGAYANTSFTPGPLMKPQGPEDGDSKNYRPKPFIKSLKYTDLNDQRVVSTDDFFKGILYFFVHFMRAAKGPICIWTEERSTMDIMVEGPRSPQIAGMLHERDIPYSIAITDVDKLIERERGSCVARHLRRTSTDVNTRKTMDWKNYHRLETIYAFMDNLAQEFPYLCEVSVIGKSVEGRDLKLLKISNGHTTNTGVWLDGTIHSREWISPAVVTYIADRIVRTFHEQPESVTNKDWYILPVLNPDGYEYTHTHDRMWRKNRARYGECVGVDLNRNFSYGFGDKGEEGSSDDPGNIFYRGPKAFSEPETAAVKRFISDSTTAFKVFLSFHSYGEVIIFPWGYTSEPCPDYVELLEGGTAMAKAIHSTNGHIYKVGSTKDLMYYAAGTSIDWSYAVPKITYSYMVELRSKNHRFLLPKEEIISTASEVLNGVLRLLDFVDRRCTGTQSCVCPK